MPNIKQSPKLFKNAGKYKILFYYSPLPQYIYDQETLQILDVNEAAILNYGYTRKEFLKLNITELRPQNDVPELTEHVENSKQAKGYIEFGKFNHTKKNGEPIVAEIFGYRMEFNNRPCTLILSKDITQREDVIKKLKKKTSNLLTAEKIAKLGYWEFNLIDESFYWSDQIYKIWGRKRNFKPTLKKLIKSIHEKDKKNVFKIINSSIDQLQNFETEFRIFSSNGSEKWIHCRGNFLFNNGQNFFEGTFQDITIKKQNLEKIVQSKARYRNLVNSQSSYVIRTDFSGNYTYCNKPYQKEYDWLFTEHHMLQSSILLSIPDHHHQRILETIQACLNEPNIAFQVEIDKHSQELDLKTTLWEIVCLTNTEGEPSEIQWVGLNISERVKAEKALQESNTRYSLVSKATSDAIWDWNPSTDQLFWGEGFETLFGYKSDQFSIHRNSWVEFLHPKDSMKAVANINKAIEGTGNNWQAQYRFKKADGAYADIIDRGYILRDKSNKVLRIVGAMQDITAQNKLKKLLNIASSLAKVGSFEIDVTSKKIFGSAMVRKITGIDLNFELSYRNCVPFFKDRKDLQLILTSIKKALSSKLSFDHKLQILTTRGEERWVRIIGIPEILEGRCVRINGSFQDIDEIKKAEIQVLKSYEEKEMILESIGDGFFAVNENWNVTYSNKKANEILGLSKHRVYGKHLHEIFSNILEEKSYSNFLKILSKNKVNNFEVLSKTGESWYDMTIYPSDKGLSVYFKDITFRKKTDLKLKELNTELTKYTEELVVANKGLEQFTFIVSHNLRAPVANIIGLGDLLNMVDHSKETEEHLLNNLIQNVKRLDDVIKDLNEILQVKKDVNLKKEKIILEDFINSIALSISDLISMEGVEIYTDFTLYPLMTSVRGYLHSVFLNLITNSIKYRVPGKAPIIKISSEECENGLIISFKDNGIGIDLDRQKNQLFMLYRRFHSHVDGKGLGLFMVKTQVELLGGKIEVQSQINMGTEFKIYFPDSNKNIKK